ncbi:MAG: ribonuclease HII [Candidatus Pacebacteria bacterium]|nr:ribonuclease HII [Candidatus Paceibacterota bacterium]
MSLDYSLERSYGKKVCGIDEVGRGPLAGPVVCAAVVLQPEFLSRDLLEAIKDSKKLTASRRQWIAAELRTAAANGKGASYGFAAASVTEIATYNILGATLRAMARAVARLPEQPDHILVDGNRLPSHLPVAATAIVGGDGKCLSIAAASILAKVLRDYLMQRLSVRYPDYGFDRHSGYGTLYHRQAIGRLGLTPHHRLLFCRKLSLGV